MTEFYDNTAGADDRGLWPGDCGTLSLDARRAFLQLLRGPMLTERRHSELWAALVTNREAVEIALANLFLALVLSEEDGIAFVRDAPVQDERIPTAVRKSKLTFCDTIMVLTLRKTLMLEGDGRAFVSKREVFDQLASYRAATSHDEAAFRKKLDASWSKMTKNNILLRTEDDQRFEVSPVLSLVFNAEEITALQEEYQDLLRETEKEGGRE